ncbi:MAG: substrate-binding domain-containing protein [Christensenellales bacterium]|nr:substrate-binding domain-containing protein [Christensenellales bacterium]
MKKILTLVLALMMVIGCCAAVAEGTHYISVISKGEQHAFWQAVRKGCEDAANEYGVEMYYYGPPSESDIVLQVEALNAEMQKQPSAIALAALSTEAVMAQLQQCVDQGVPVIGFDSGVPNAPEGAIYATASTNNQNAAALAAEEMVKLEGFADALKAGTPEAPVIIGVLSQDATSESVTGRTTGFVNKMVELASEYNTVAVTGHDLWAKEAEGAGVIVKVEIAATPEITDVTNAANALLNTEGMYAVFCSNEGAVNGFLAATSSGADLGEGGAYADLIVAGFDAGAPQKNAVREGWFVGSVTQDPYQIGYQAVELAVKAANGVEVEDIDTGAQWYTAANIDDPDIALLVYD